MIQDEGISIVFEAGAAAERLGVSPSGMRRLAVIYEQVHGDLPRRTDAKGRVTESAGRLYSGEVLGRWETSRGPYSQL